MFHRLLSAAALLLCFHCASAQVLFTYGKTPVTVKEFQKAYQKNNAADKNSSINDYLQLYINSKLKVKEALARGYDTMPQMQIELQNLREQILPNYMNDDEAVNKLVHEAFLRSQKDIHLAHIFIGFSKTANTDTAAAWKKATEAYNKLKKGSLFATVAKEYSDDPSVSKNGGDIGYITAFTLPYELENLAYKTPIGKVSNIYHSGAGYHIFKNIEERTDPGKMKIAQILFAFPPDTSDITKMATKHLADSIYSLIQNGEDFGKLATKYSNDVISAVSNGVVPDFGIGQYEPAFEDKVYSLSKDGEISKPFLTSHGWHIIKRISHTPAPTTLTEQETRTLKEKVETSDRINTTHELLAKKILSQAGFKSSFSKMNELWAFSDSAFDGKKSDIKYHIEESQPLFSIGKEVYTVSDWANYGRTNRFKRDGSGAKPYQLVWKEFVQNSAIDYYKKNLEKYNPAFKAQVEEFKDGNLFFEIMQREIWGPGQTDTVALKNYYDQHKAKYSWAKSVDAVMFYASDAKMANEAWKKISANPSKWKAVLSTLDDKVASDSNRFEAAQIPNPSNLPLNEGVLTQPQTNNDNAASFAYILHVYPQSMPKSFAEAKGQVASDYQQELESKWIKELRSKYPVVINQSALASLKK